MTRRLAPSLLGLLPICTLLACSLLGAASAPGVRAEGATSHRIFAPLIAGPPAPALLFSALLYDGIVTGEADEAFQLYNPSEFAVQLEGWQVQSGTRTAIFPPGLTLGPHARLWCAREATAFRHSFGHLPDCEWGADTDPLAPNLLGGSLILANAGGAVLVRRPDGTTSDAVVYKAGALPSDATWRGPNVTPYTPSSVFHEQGQILYRKVDERTGMPLNDTDAAVDWATDASDVLAGRRVRYPGWSFERFSQPLVGDEPAALQVFVSPDHAFEALSAHLAQAAHSIRLEGYTFESAPLGLLLAERAKAGIVVSMLLEGAPPGGVTDQQRWVIQQLNQAGARVFYMRSNSAAGTHDRYTNQHAKVWLIDDRLALIGSENASPDSFPNDDKGDGTIGRRGVYLATDAAGVVGRVRGIMDADMSTGQADVWPYDPADPSLGAPPADFVPVLTSGGSQYRVRVPQPLAVQGRYHLEVCQAPEHALRTSDCLLGLVSRVGPGDTLLVEQLDEPTYWGPSTGSVATDPNPRLDAYLAAARRGATVRILLDSFFDDLASSRSNLRTQEYLESVAHAESLDLQVRRANPTGLGVHNKMVLAEVGGQGWAMVGSLNGGEASMKLNREVSLVVESAEVYRYLEVLFWGDWGQ